MVTQLNVSKHSDDDERDEALRAADPDPAVLAPLYPSPDDFAVIAAAPAAGTVTVVAVNRAIREVIPGCRISIGGASAVANTSGSARVDISALADGAHEFTVTPEHTSEVVVGPGFPSDTTVPRIWRAWKGSVTVQGGQVKSAEPAQWTKLMGQQIEVRVQPAWMLPRTSSRKRTEKVDLVIVHHTYGALPGDCNEFLYNPKKGVHYLIAPNGETYKFVDDEHVASHAGYSYWAGAEGVNSRSIGIEMSHNHGPYPEEQLAALIALIQRITSAYPGIPRNRIVAHSDVGITEPKYRPPTKVDRKSSDPGSLFPWERIEALGYGLILDGGAVPPEIYGGYFVRKPAGKLLKGDNDQANRYGGEIIPALSGVVNELQQDLSRIGYLCSPIDGDYGRITESAVQMFQQHMFSGSRRLSDNPEGGDGKLDHATAKMIKQVLAHDPVASA